MLKRRFLKLPQRIFPFLSLRILDEILKFIRRHKIILLCYLVNKTLEWNNIRNTSEFYHFIQYLFERNPIIVPLIQRKKLTKKKSGIFIVRPAPWGAISCR